LANIFFARPWTQIIEIQCALPPGTKFWRQFDSRLFRVFGTWSVFAEWEAFGKLLTKNSYSERVDVRRPCGGSLQAPQKPTLKSLYWYDRTLWFPKMWNWWDVCAITYIDPTNCDGRASYKRVRLLEIIRLIQARTLVLVWSSTLIAATMYS
jgi:hypothetical protein